MRVPNPPRVLLDGLTKEEQKKIILLALEVVHDLASGNEWGAFEKVEYANMDIEMKLAFCSLLNSQQGAVLGSLGQAASDKKVYRE